MPRLVAAPMCLEQTISYNLSGWQLFLFCVVLPILLSLTGLWIARRIIPSHYLNQNHDVTGPFFSTLGTVYGIFLAFIVSTTWQAFSNTQSNLVQEARYLGNIYFTTNAFPEPVRGHLQKLLIEYRDSLIKGEWQTMERGEANPKTSQLIKEIGYAYMNYRVTDPAVAPFLQESIHMLSAMTGLRASRIDDSSSGLLPVLWCVLLLGAVATIGFSFLFEARNFKAQAVMTILLTGVISMAFFTIINFDFPFTGVTTISAEPIEHLEMK